MPPASDTYTDRRSRPYSLSGHAPTRRGTIRRMPLPAPLRPLDRPSLRAPFGAAVRHQVKKLLSSPILLLLFRFRDAIRAV